jgi:hypothetical protein
MFNVSAISLSLRRLLAILLRPLPDHCGKENTAPQPIRFQYMYFDVEQP